MGPIRSPRALTELTTLLDLLKMTVFMFVRCWHSKKGPLITLRSNQPRKGVPGITGTYFVCLNCGKEFAYDLEQGRVIDTAPSQIKMLLSKANELSAGK
jgi:hypothetical protein